MSNKGPREIGPTDDGNSTKHDAKQKTPERRLLDASRGDITNTSELSDPDKPRTSPTHKLEDPSQASIFDQEGQNKDLKFLFGRLGLDLPRALTQKLEENVTQQLERDVTTELKDMDLKRKADTLGIDIELRQTPEAIQRQRDLTDAGDAGDDFKEIKRQKAQERAQFRKHEGQYRLAEKNLRFL